MQQMKKNVTANKKQFDHSKIKKSLDKLINSYGKSLFTSKIGKLKDAKIKLHINNNIPPIAQAEHRIPFALRKSVQKQIAYLEQQDIIKDITSEATSWLSQVVLVPKSNCDVRLCINMRNANTAIEKTRYFSKHAIIPH